MPIGVLGDCSPDPKQCRCVQHSMVGNSMEQPFWRGIPSDYVKIAVEEKAIEIVSCPIQK